MSLSRQIASRSAGSPAFAAAFAEASADIDATDRWVNQIIDRLVARDGLDRQALVDLFAGRPGPLIEVRRVCGDTVDDTIVTQVADMYGLDG